MKNFQNLFHHELRDMHSAEVQIVQLLPRLAQAADTQQLKDAFEKHYIETQQHVVRLEKIAKDLEIPLGGRECKVMQVIAEEAEKIITADYPPEVRDAALISCAQRMEHYEIAVYGTLKAFAKHLGLKDVEQLLNETSKEEGAADKKLTEIAVGTVFGTGVNQQAVRKTA
ncbi:MAG: ferritin-like domain-containing protein [Chlamydiales bacterium]